MKVENDKKKAKNPLQSAAEKALWVRMIGLTSENKEILLRERNIDVDAIDDMHDDEHYLYLPLHVMIKSAEDIGQRRLLIVIMGDYDLITIQDEESFPPFDSISRHIRSYPESLDSPESLLCFILHVLNEQASKVIAAIGMRLETISHEISQLTTSLEEEKNTLGIADINEKLSALNEKEELISRCLESQLSLARAARYLDVNVPDKDKALQGLIRSLREDINGVKEHATYEHDSVRYLQNAILASLNIKQNQIVKVFTIITAVFLPPTLIASIYGMNFKVMPELAWKYGFQAAVLLALIAALLPLIYIKWKRWLR
jgi:magnesium transporter